MAHVLRRLISLFLAEATVPVTITSPTCGGTITNASVTVVWIVSPGTQYSYRLRVYSDSALTTLIYDSGVVVSSAMTAAIPFGILSTGRTYYASVSTVMTDGSEGVSGSCAWTTNFSTSANVTGLTLRLVGACGGDAGELPGVQISWTVITPGGSETFVEYDVKRREAGTTNWSRIAVVTTRLTHSVYDYTCLPGTSYQYAVTWTAISGSSTLISAEQSPAPSATPSWDHLFVHDWADPSRFVRVDTWQVDEQIRQAVAFLQLQGRQQATAQIGEAQGKHWRIPAQSRPMNEPHGDMWVDLLDLITAQRAEGIVLCARYGAARSGMFCQGSVERSVNQRSYDAAVDLTETYLDEFV